MYANNDDNDNGLSTALRHMRLVALLRLAALGVCVLAWLGLWGLVH
jgi:hypothetical protein